MKTLKFASLLVMSLVMGVFLVGCEPPEPPIPTPIIPQSDFYSMDVVIEVGERVEEDQLEMVDTEISYQLPNGEKVTQLMPKVNRWKITEMLPYELPINMVVTVKQSLKPGVDLSRKESYQVGYGADFYVMGLVNGSQVVDVNGKGFTNYMSCDADKMEELFPYEDKMHIFVDVTGEIFLIHE